MTLHDFNMLGKEDLRKELFRCCGSDSWVEKMMKYFPMEDLVELLEDAEETWFECTEKDWKKAFAQHPRIGDKDSLRKKFANTAEWAAGEQAGVANAKEETIEALAAANKLYEEKFGYIFIVNATGRSAEEILGMLHARLINSPDEEIKIAVDEQNKITKIRLEKLLDS